MTGYLYQRNKALRDAATLRKQLKGDVVTRAKKAVPSKRTKLKMLERQMRKQGRVT